MKALLMSHCKHMQRINSATVSIASTLAAPLTRQRTSSQVCLEEQRGCCEQPLEGEGHWAAYPWKHDSIAHHYANIVRKKSLPPLIYYPY